jgi:hypothetical protein
MTTAQPQRNLMADSTAVATLRRASFGLLNVTFDRSHLLRDSFRYLVIFQRVN